MVQSLRRSNGLARAPVARTCSQTIQASCIHIRSGMQAHACGLVLLVLCDVVENCAGAAAGYEEDGQQHKYRGSIRLHGLWSLRASHEHRARRLVGRSVRGLRVRVRIRWRRVRPHGGRRIRWRRRGGWVALQRVRRSSYLCGRRPPRMHGHRRRGWWRWDSHVVRGTPGGALQLANLHCRTISVHVRLEGAQRGSAAVSTACAWPASTCECGAVHVRYKRSRRRHSETQIQTILGRYTDVAHHVCSSRHPVAACKPVLKTHACS